jgi:hypothetical protein
LSPPLLEARELPQESSLENEAPEDDLSWDEDDIENSERSGSPSISPPLLILKNQMHEERGSVQKKIYNHRVHPNIEMYTIKKPPPQLPGLPPKICFILTPN